MARKSRPLVEGWTRISASRYRDPEGVEVSRRQYDNARLQTLGFSTRAERERLSHDPTYRHFMNLIAEREGRTRTAIVRDPEFSRLAGEAQRQGWGKKREGRSPDSPTAKILVRAGLRRKGSRNRIGEGYQRRRRARRR